MTARTDADRPAQPSRPRRVRRRRHLLPRANRTLVLLVALTVLITLVVLAWPGTAPMTTLMIPLLLGSLLLGPRQLPWFVVFVMVMLMLAIARQPELDARIVLAITILYALCFIVLTTSFRRSRLGVAGVQGESMLVDLRDRILSQGGIPPLPSGWLVEGALRSAGGTPFAGDFVVAVVPRDSDRLQIVVVDVSGKGEQAGTRALLLSGAFGGLLGALEPAEFLPAANEYLLNQRWDEGFATAIHLSLDLETGDFEVRAAGHPPAAQLDAGSGRWSVHEAEGPVLGLIEDAEFTTVSGVLRPGDAMMLYTDGMVETPKRDIGLGIDRMLGQAERLLRGDFEGGADRLVDALGSHNDDRALVLVHRR
ncbi:serine/threonine-protein phosphatase [Nocardioides sp. LMS-CY]|uniref:PP2C family protein-serine/threonine phosphatase n=1 Tax=Nocardioides sp. (strain LMS-CY) TaxID=2840457 RepID=UPI001C00127F|nr:PP2C family protein-serine/threonine phosphatase [Nocardioides sp. LMS-CY]QWF23738.1 serine/threonine-protein phosphatase [Nocardioides sp. LMS-CY]